MWAPLYPSDQRLSVQNDAASAVGPGDDVTGLQGSERFQLLRAEEEAVDCPQAGSYTVGSGGVGS